MTERKVREKEDPMTRKEWRRNEVLKKEWSAAVERIKDRFSAYMINACFAGDDERIGNIERILCLLEDKTA